MSRPLKFKIKDYDFISRKFPEYYRLLVPNASRHGDEMWIDTKDQEAYDYLLDNLCLEFCNRTIFMQISNSLRAYHNILCDI